MGNFISNWLDENAGGWRPGSNLGIDYKDITGSIGQNWMGATPENATGAGIGSLMNLGGMLGMADPNQYSREYLANLNSQLQPLMDSHQKMGEMAKMYEDPNSQFNQGMRDQVRSSNIDYAYEIANRDRQRALGTGYGDLGRQQNTSMLTDAVSSGLKNLSQQRGQQMQQAAALRGQQGTLSNALSQAQLQNRLMAGQQAQLPFQLMAGQGIGLLQKSLYGG